MSKMTQDEIDKHNENPNTLLTIGGKKFRCKCGCNVFHHIDDNDIFICNSCDTEYITSDDDDL